jgi:hypothetical protein
VWSLRIAPQYRAATSTFFKRPEGRKSQGTQQIGAWQIGKRKIAQRSLHTAIHEAGHAAIGRVLTLPCQNVTIEPDISEMTAGHSITPDPYECQSEWESLLGDSR